MLAVGCQSGMSVVDWLSGVSCRLGVITVVVVKMSLKTKATEKMFTVSFHPILIIILC